MCVCMFLRVRKSVSVCEGVRVCERESIAASDLPLSFKM